MRRTHRLPASLIRWTSVCVCFVLVVASLTIIPLWSSSGQEFAPTSPGRKGQSGNGNGRGQKVKPAPPLPGAPEARIPSLEEVRQRRLEAPAAPPHIASTMRSRRRPLEARHGRKVGDPLPPKRSASAKETGDGSERVNIASADAPSRTTGDPTVRSPRSLPQAARTGTSRSPALVLLSLLRQSSIRLVPDPAFDFLRYPALNFADQILASSDWSITVWPTSDRKEAALDFFFSPMPQSGSSGRIAFASNRDGSAQLYSMNTDGSGLLRLTNDAANDEAPKWSPNNPRIVFQSDRDNLFSGNADIYVMNWDGSGQSRLTSDVNDDSAPVWSPDGTKIAFQSARNGVSYQVYVMNADGSGQVNISNSAANDKQPSWSPDGTKIAFASDRDQAGFSSIYVMNANGSNQTRLTFSGR